MPDYYIKSLFVEIQDELLNRIAQANNEILIAVAWFTNRDLFDRLLSSLERGVKCSCLLHDDIINRSEYNLDFSKFIDAGGNLRFYSSERGLMHNKFCLIDSSTLYTGSYNWTYSAEYRNKESLIVTNDPKVCTDFASYFVELWDTCQSIVEYKPLSMKNIFDSSFQSVKNELYREYGVMADKSIIDGQIVKKLDIIKGLTSSNENVNRIYSQNDKYSLKFNIGMRCRINNVDNQTLNIIKMGTLLPIRNASVAFTNVYDNPQQMFVELLLGNNENADDNITLCKLVNDNIPKLASHKLNMRAVVDIDSNGCIKLSNVCMNNKSTVTTTLLAPDIIEKKTHKQ